MTTPGSSVSSTCPPARDEDAAITSTPYSVDDVMTKKVIAFSPDAGFKEIATYMERWKVSAAPVVEGEGHVVGVVSEADLLKVFPRSDDELAEEIRCDVVLLLFLGSRRRIAPPQQRMGRGDP